MCIHGFLLLFRKVEAGPAMEPGPAALQLLSAEEGILKEKNIDLGGSVLYRGEGGSGGNNKV